MGKHKFKILALRKIKEGSPSNFKDYRHRIGHDKRKYFLYKLPVNLCNKNFRFINRGGYKNLGVCVRKSHWKNEDIENKPE